MVTDKTVKFCILKTASDIQANVIKTKSASTILSEVLSHFDANADELSVDVTDPEGKNVIFRNYFLTETPKTKSTRSQITLFGPSEFDVFTIRSQNTITIFLKVILGLRLLRILKLQGSIKVMLYYQGQAM